MNEHSSPGAVTSEPPSRTVWLIGGVLAAASLAAGAGMLMRGAMPSPVSQGTANGETVPAGTRQAAAAQPQSRPAQAVPATRQVAAAPATACHDCGVVESVRAVTHKGPSSGAGALAGGVLGGVLGNQLGHGNGRAAMTVLGAVGGGVAGDEIEKRTKSVIVHQVTVRMDDGSVRTIEQAEAPRTGDRVVVEGNHLKPVPAAASQG